MCVALSDIDWASIPLGACPGNSDPASLNLELDSNDSAESRCDNRENMAEDVDSGSTYRHDQRLKTIASRVLVDYVEGVHVWSHIVWFVLLRNRSEASQYDVENDIADPECHMPASSFSNSHDFHGVNTFIDDYKLKIL